MITTLPTGGGVGGSVVVVVVEVVVVVVAGGSALEGGRHRASATSATRQTIAAQRRARRRTRVIIGRPGHQVEADHARHAPARAGGSPVLRPSGCVSVRVAAASLGCRQPSSEPTMPTKDTISPG